VEDRRTRSRDRDRRRRDGRDDGLGHDRGGGDGGDRRGEHRRDRRGGVHLGAEQTWDVSADLPALARHSLVLVCAGTKAICDPGKTLEYLDTAGVTVVAFGTDRFPHFYTADSGYAAPRRIDAPEQAAAILAAKRRLGQPGALLVAAPIPRGEALQAELVADAVARAVAQVGAVRGGDLTPALLAALTAITGGRTLRANLALLRANARLAAAIAAAWYRKGSAGD